MAEPTPFDDDESPFGSYGHDFNTQGSWLSSIAASSTIYVLFAILLASGMATKTYIQRKRVPVKFVEKVVKPPAPALPPPPKIIELKPVEPPKVLPRQAAPAANVPKDMKVR